MTLHPLSAHFLHILECHFYLVTFEKSASFGDVGVSLFVASAIFGDAAMLSWQAQILVKFGYYR